MNITSDKYTTSIGSDNSANTASDKYMAKPAVEMERKVDDKAVRARDFIMRDMKQRGFGALLWGANLFGSTDYPLIDMNGKEKPLKGFRLAGPGQLVGVVSLPDSIDITGVKAYTPMEADRIIGTVAHGQNFYDTGGTPEEWMVAADCYRTAVHTLDAEKIADRPPVVW